MIARATASAVLDGCKGEANRPTATTTLWQSEIDFPRVALSLACCPLELEMSSTFSSKNNAFQSNPASLDLGRQVQSARDKAQKQTTEETMKGDYFTEDKQNDEVGSAMTEEFNSSFMGVSEKERKRKNDAVQFKDWVSARATAKNPQGRERSVVPGYGGESNGYEELRKYSMSMDEPRRRPSMSQYKGAQVPRPNGQCGAQIYEKHQRVCLGPFNGELDAARAYDGSFLEFRDRDAITVSSPTGDCGEEAQFIRKHGKEEIIEMFPKDTYDDDFDHRCKRIIMTVARSATRNNAEERSVLRDHVCQKMKGVVDRDASASSSAAGMACLPCEHLFDKAVTPSDVGKLNRLVIPKQHAEKYFPLDINQSEKGLLLDFEDNTGKIWTFRYSYWNSSQSYVLTKGWTRFVKDKKLEAGDIVSFQRGSSERHQLYISWRPGPSGLYRFRAGPQPHQSKAGVAYRVKAGSSSLNPFNPRTQANVLYNSQSMPNFWPSSTNPNASTLFNSQYSVSPFVSKVALSSQTPVTRLHGTLHPSLSPPSHIQTAQSKFYDMKPHGLLPTDLYPSLHSSLTSSDGGTNIRVPHRFVNPAPRSAAQELERPEEAESSVDLTAKKGVRVFGVTLAEPRRLSAVQHHGLLNLLPAEPLR